MFPLRNFSSIFQLCILVRDEFAFVYLFFGRVHQNLYMNI
ncbi:hypothetical protein BAP_87 [Bacillus sp. CN2]|nr:hypothetical protein BAP_87 [Bacillus sp. CN2]